MGSMIFSERLQASAKRVVAEKSSIVRRIACCAPSVIESASSRMMILCLPGGSVTFFCANALMRPRTTSMPRSSEAFSSSTASLKASPSIVRASASTLVVLPVPGGPERIRLGMLPCCASTCSRPTVSSLPTTSSITLGRYFSSHGCSKASPFSAIILLLLLPLLLLLLPVPVAASQPRICRSSREKVRQVKSSQFPTSARHEDQGMLL